MPLYVIRSTERNAFTSVARARLLAATVSETIFVDNLNGNDTTGNGTAAAPYKTVFKGFESIPVAPLWVVTNAAYTVNAATGNDGTGARFGGKFASITAAQTDGAYTVGDTIYVEAGTYNLASHIGGSDYCFQEGANVSYTGNVVWSARADRNYAVAGRMALTMTNVNAQAGAFDTNRTSYVQYKSITTPASYANHTFAATGGNSNAKAYVWVDSDYTHTSNGATRIMYQTGAHISEIRMRNVTTDGSNAFVNSSSGNYTIYCNSFAHTAGTTNYCVDQSGMGTVTFNCTGSVTVVGGAFSSAANGDFVANVTGNITSSGTGTSLIINGSSSQFTIVCGGTITSGPSGNCVICNAANAKIDITAVIITSGNTTNPSPISVGAATHIMKVRNADIRGQNTVGGFGPIRHASGATLELYSCILRSFIVSPQASIREITDGAATVTYFGACELSDAVHASITEVNTGNRTINSSLRF